jgi:peptide/nickel transport system ATP-binding protein
VTLLLCIGGDGDTTADAHTTRGRGLTMALLEIRNLHLAMRSFDGEAHVLNGIDLTVERREVWGVVGETGCGKSLTGLSISRLVATPPGRYLDGEIRFDGHNVLRLTESEMRTLRGRRIGMIFQDPTTNLNPTFRIGTQLIDVALAAGRASPEVLGVAADASTRARRGAARRLAVDMLRKVGITDPEARFDNYPHEFSGGMRQRVLIAMALIGRPDLLIADEPTTALDVSVQAQVLALLKGMVAEFNMGVVLITHNLGVVATACTHVAVMYAGNIVESGPVHQILTRPRHPYTEALLDAIPSRHVKRGDLKGLAGVVPSLINPPPGCRFAPRCALATEVCQRSAPKLDGAAHRVACYHRTADRQVA